MFAQFVSILQHLLLLFAQAFQTLFNFLALLFVFGGLKSGLQFANLLIQILLPRSQLAQTALHLSQLAVLFLLFFLCDTFRFVSVLTILKFQLIELLLTLTRSISTNISLDDVSKMLNLMAGMYDQASSIAAAHRIAP